ncbi:tetratricopeptide repeat protein [Photobacterium leiognathi]|uniref:tetratricopeptide repeat protein n=1 Tax=Photobacterium leiognathi TaxID=553611 RepID=UPI00273779F6|nr:tetratricopeptide repeat protein [Photobacterium leiognathi]
MSHLIWLFIIPIIILGWLISRYFVTQKTQQTEKQQQVVKDIKYRQVLEKAKQAEREEKIYKASTGHIPSQLSLAKEYEITNVKEALAWYEKAAEQGNEIAQYALARLYRRDSTDKQAILKANYWQALIDAKQNTPETLFYFGLLVIQGKGVEANSELGIENILQAAEFDHLPALLFLSEWYAVEDTDHYLPQQAFHWRVRAAKQNDVDGIMKTAFCYQTGLGVDTDPLKVKYWLKRAAEHDHPEAQYLVGKMHLGATANDAAVAYIWFSMAYASGYQKARQARDQAAPHIGIESILNVQNIAKEVYKALKQQPVPPHTIIALLDSVYARDGYRPTTADIDLLCEEALFICPTAGAILDNTETNVEDNIEAVKEDVDDEKAFTVVPKPLSTDDWGAQWSSPSLDIPSSSQTIKETETKTAQP